MKKLLILSTLICLCISCNKKPYDSSNSKNESMETIDEHSSKNSLDWEGVYTSILPCADCEGIETQIHLFSDNTYVLKQKYLGKESQFNQSSGKFEWNTEGSKITLSNEATKPVYLLGENTLFYLDKNQNIIQGDLADKYQLKQKNSSNLNRIKDSKWNLIEMDGKTYTYADQNQAFFELDSTRIYGKNGCNLFNGSYIKKDNRIEFGEFMTTSMACLDMKSPEQFNRFLSEHERYTLTADEIYFYQNGKNTLVFQKEKTKK